MLVLDGGIRGLVIKLGKDLAQITHTGNLVKAGAGALLSDVAKYAASQGLTGLEFAVGIPGSIGGAVFMNAGAYDGNISAVVESATAVCPDGDIYVFSGSELDFGYRHSIFQKNSCIISEISIYLKYGQCSLIENRMSELTMLRNEKQPLEMPSAGSTFKRPKGYFAGTLIEQAGIKGFKLGGAQVSEKHAGFIINAGKATARDILGLIKEVQRIVKGKCGVELQPEVKILGEEGEV